MMINVLFVIKTNTVTMHTLKLASYSAKKKKKFSINLYNKTSNKTKQNKRIKLIRRSDIDHTPEKL